MEAMTLERSTCKWCDGDGYLPGESPAKRCRHCNGRGTKSGNVMVASRLPDDLVLALSYSRNFAEANPRLTKTAKEHILGLCDLLEKQTAHLAQPAQAVDVGALQKVAADLASVARLTDHDLTRGTCQSASERITRALSGEKAGPVGDGWTARRDDELRLWWVYSPSGAAAGIYDQAAGVHAELLRQLAQFLPTSPTPDKEGA